MKNEYLDRIAAGYVRQLSIVNKIETKTRQIFASFHRNGCPEPTEYMSLLESREKARKILDRWLRIFDSATKRIANQ